MMLHLLERVEERSTNRTAKNDPLIQKEVEDPCAEHQNDNMLTSKKRWTKFEKGHMKISADGENKLNMEQNTLRQMQMKKVMSNVIALLPMR